MPRAGWRKPESDRRLSDLVSVGVLTRGAPCVWFGVSGGGRGRGGGHRERVHGVCRMRPGALGGDIAHRGPEPGRELRSGRVVRAHEHHALRAGQQTDTTVQIERFGARTLQRLMAEGAYSLEARTVMPSR